MAITFTSDPAEMLALDVDARALVTDLQRESARNWTQALLGGRKASGGALPTNKAGKPLGQGDGTIATTWENSPVEGDARAASATSGPGQQGGLYYAVQAMVDADANPASIDGDAARVIDRVVNAHADKAVRT